MEWIVNIENEKNRRILVRFDPINHELAFIGQYKPHNKEWENFCRVNQSMFTESQSSHHLFSDLVLIDADRIQYQITRTYDELKKLIEAYEEFAEAFGLLKMIEVKSDDTK